LIIGIVIFAITQNADPNSLINSIAGIIALLIIVWRGTAFYFRKKDARIIVSAKEGFSLGRIFILL
jgi:hypothetical protein